MASADTTPLRRRFGVPTPATFVPSLDLVVEDLPALLSTSCHGWASSSSATPSLCEKVAWYLQEAEDDGEGVAAAAPPWDEDRIDATTCPNTTLAAVAGGVGPNSGVVAATAERPTHPLPRSGSLWRWYYDDRWVYASRFAWKMAAGNTHSQATLRMGRDQGTAAGANDPVAPSCPPSLSLRRGDMILDETVPPSRVRLQPTQVASLLLALDIAAAAAVMNGREDGGGQESLSRDGSAAAASMVHAFDTVPPHAAADVRQEATIMGSIMRPRVQQERRPLANCGRVVPPAIRNNRPMSSARRICGDCFGGGCYLDELCRVHPLEDEAAVVWDRRRRTPTVIPPTAHSWSVQVLRCDASGVAVVFRGSLFDTGLGCEVTRDLWGRGAAAASDVDGPRERGRRGRGGCAAARHPAASSHVPRTTPNDLLAVEEEEPRPLSPQRRREEDPSFEQRGASDAGRTTSPMGFGSSAPWVDSWLTPPRRGGPSVASAASPPRCPQPQQLSAMNRSSELIPGGGSGGGGVRHWPVVCLHLPSQIVALRQFLGAALVASFGAFDDLDPTERAPTAASSERGRGTLATPRSCVL